MTRSLPPREEIAKALRESSVDQFVVFSKPSGTCGGWSVSLTPRLRDVAKVVTHLPANKSFVRLLDKEEAARRSFPPVPRFPGYMVKGDGTSETCPGCSRRGQLMELRSICNDTMLCIPYTPPFILETAKGEPSSNLTRGKKHYFLTLTCLLCDHTWSPRGSLRRALRDGAYRVYYRAYHPSEM